MKLSCSPNIVEEEVYKEYWMKSFKWSESTWLKWYTEQDGCSYKNKNERWIWRTANVYGLDVKYELYEKSNRISNNGTLNNLWIKEFRDHEFTWKQRYLRPDWVWVEFDLWIQSWAYWTAQWCIHWNLTKNSHNSS